MSDELRSAAQALVDKLEAVHADPQYISVWQLNYIHGGRYTGPQYDKELAALKVVLSPSRPEDADTPPQRGKDAT